MSSDQVTILVGLLGALGGFLAKSRLSDVIVSGSEREKTAVSTMAGILDKAMDGLVRMSVSVESMAGALAGHERDSNLRWQTERDLLRAIQADVTEMRQRHETLVRVLSERNNV